MAGPPTTVYCAAKGQRSKPLGAACRTRASRDRAVLMSVTLGFKLPFRLHYFLCQRCALLLQLCLVFSHPLQPFWEIGSLRGFALGGFAYFFCVVSSGVLRLKEERYECGPHHFVLKDLFDQGASVRKHSQGGRLYSCVREGAYGDIQLAGTTPLHSSYVEPVFN